MVFLILGSISFTLAHGPFNVTEVHSRAWDSGSEVKAEVHGEGKFYSGQEIPSLTFHKYFLPVE